MHAGAASKQDSAILRAAVLWLNVHVSSELAKRLLQHIRKRELMRAGDRVAVAVSGGADSVALVRLMIELRGELGVVLSVAHFNHRIRGEAADADEAFVRDLARAHNLQFWYADADVPAYARESKLSLEAAARLKRYEFFENIVACGSADRIATAHTLDDQAETVLMRIIRGTGVSGLIGIHERVTIKAGDTGDDIGAIVRPLLATRRPELEAYLHSLDQPWREDASNADLHHTRNRIRQLVLPLLEREFNPAIRERLAELAEIARSEEDYWNEHLRDLMSATRMLRYVRYDTPWTFYAPAAMPESSLKMAGGVPPESVPTELPNIGIDRSRLLELFLAERRRFVRHATADMMPLSYSEVERVLQLARGDIAGAVELARGLQAWCERDASTQTEVLMVGVPPQRTASIVDETYSVSISPIGTTETVVDRCRIRVSSQHGTGLAGALDLRKLPAPELILRPWRPGDRFWPQHSSGPKKVKELLTDKHITGRDRQLWPVIACGDNIVWLRGFGASQAFVADEHATEAIVITERPLQS